MTISGLESIIPTLEQRLVLAELVDYSNFTSMEQTNNQRFSSLNYMKKLNEVQRNRRATQARDNRARGPQQQMRRFNFALGPSSGPGGNNQMGRSYGLSQISRFSGRVGAAFNRYA